MNFQSAVNNIKMLAGGAIPGEDLLNSSQIWGVTIAGIGIVFACLVLLVFVIFLFGKIFESINKAQAAKQAAVVAKNAPKTASKPAAAPTPKPQAAPVAVTNDDDDEVIAVISAVVAAMSAADGTTYKVRSVKPAASNSLGGRTAWAMDGRRSNIMPF